MSLLNTELLKLGANEVVIEADFRESDIRLDGMPRASARQPDFPGVRIAFESKHGPLKYETDSCVFWQHNVRSIALGLEALRAVDRYGITSRAEQYTGFKALPGGPRVTFTSAAEALTWLRSEECLGIVGGGLMAAKQAYRMAVRNHHPDAGGSPAMWARVNAAHQILVEEGYL